jgi:hypothetical protein
MSCSSLMTAAAINKAVYGLTDQPEGLVSLFLPVTALELQTAAYSMTGADPLDGYGYVHRGDPDTKDRNGDTKRKVQRMAFEGDLKFFHRWAQILNGNSVWLKYMQSTRVMVPKRDTTKFRPIDLPSEMKRAYTLVVRSRLQELIRQSGGDDFWPKGIVGYRKTSDFELGDRRKQRGKWTIQDVFASWVYRVAQTHPVIVAVDQEDAFGLLPHKAIAHAFKELGCSHTDIRRLIELVRIRSWYKGRLLFPRGRRSQAGTGRVEPAFGIEQGNPLAPLVFNIVHRVIAIRLSAKGIPSGFFGDDIGLGQADKGKARSAFEAYSEIATDLGFKNIQSLGTEGKATRIIDTRMGEVDLLRTFAVSQTAIRLTVGKQAALIASFQEAVRMKKVQPSLKALRKLNPYKSVSKAHLKEIYNEAIQGSNMNGNKTLVPSTEGTPRERTASSSAGSRRPELPIRGDEEEGYADTLFLFDATASVEGGSSTPEDRADGDDDPLQDSYDGYPTDGDSSLYVDSLSLLGGDLDHLPGSSCITTDEKENQESPGSPDLNGIQASLRGPGEAGVTVSQSKEAASHRASLPTTVVVARKKHLHGFNQGNRLQLGDDYRPNKQNGGPVVLDLRNLNRDIPKVKLRRSAVQDLVRACTVRGRATVWVTPGDSIVTDDFILGGAMDKGYTCQDRHTDFDKGCLVFSLRRKVGPVIHRKQKVSLPELEVVVKSSKPVKGKNQFRIYAFVTGEPQTTVLPVQTKNLSIGKLYSIARFLDRFKGKAVAFRVSKMGRHLIAKKKIRPSEASLKDALQILGSGWSWSSVNGWLVGEPKLP